MRRLTCVVVLMMAATAGTAAAAPGDRILVQRDLTLPVAGQPRAHLRIQLKDDFVRSEPAQRALEIMPWVRDSYGRYETAGGYMADEDYADFTIRKFTVRPVGSRAIVDLVWYQIGSNIRHELMLSESAWGNSKALKETPSTWPAPKP